MDGNQYIEPQKQGVNPIPATQVVNGIISAAEVRNRYEKGLRALNWEYREYWLNYAYWRDRQWVRWDVSTDRIVPINRIGSRYQATVNKIRPAINSTLGTLMKEPLVFEVPPQAADDYALQGSQVGEAILRNKGLDADWEEKRENLYIAMLIGGTAGLAVEWDSTAHEYTADIKTGDTIESVLPIVDFVVEPAAKKAKDARWWIKSQVMNPEEVQAMYNLPQAPPSDALTGGPFHQRILPTADTRMNQQQGCLVLTYYERPNNLRKTGAITVVVNNEIVWGPTEWTFPFKDHLNLDVAKCIPVPGKWTGDTYVSSVRSVQTQLNFVWTNIHENTKALGMNKLLLPYGASDIENQFDDDPAHPIRYPEGVEKPSYLSPAIVPPHIIEQVTMLENEIGDIMGVHAISQGDTPANIESGYGLSILAEQDTTPIGRIAKEGARVLGMMATMVLQMYADRVKDTRTSIVYSKGQPAMPVKWQGKDLAGQTRAIVPPDTVLPRNRAAMQKLGETLMQMRPDFFQSFAQFAEFTSMPGSEDLLWALDDDTAKARYENALMMSGEIVAPEDFDNHSKHIQEHNRERKSPRYMAATPEIKNIIDKHIAAHEGMAREEAGIQAAKQAYHPALAALPTGNEAQLPPTSGGMPPGGQQMPPQQLPQQGV